MATTSTCDTSTGARRSLSAADNHSGVTSAGYRGIDTTALISGTPPLLGRSTDRSTVRDTARAAVNHADLFGEDAPFGDLRLVHRARRRGACPSLAPRSSRPGRVLRTWRTRTHHAAAFGHA